MSDLLLSELDAGVLQLTFNRPDKKNALTQEMYSALADALDRANQDSAVRVLHITGAEDAFTSGNDIADFQAPTSDQEPPVFRFIRGLPQLSVPLVAAVNGLAIGVGVTMLLHCDFVYASERAVFATPFVDLALVPEAASSQLMPARMGYLAAARMLMLGEKFDADQALACGLVGEVLPADLLLQQSMATAHALVDKPASSLRTCKTLMRREAEPVLARMEREFEEFGALLTSPEAAEAMAAFMEKRQPNFKQFS